MALTSRDRAKRAAAEEALGQITDPRAVPMVWMLFVRGDQARPAPRRPDPRPDQRVGLVAGSCPAGRLQPLGRRPPVVPSEILRHRDPRDFAELLANLIRDPIKYKVKSVKGPGSQGELLVEGKDANVKRLYTPMAAAGAHARLPAQHRCERNARRQPDPRLVLDFDRLGSRCSSGALTPTDVSGLLQQTGLSPGQSKQLGQTLAGNANRGLLALDPGYHGWQV